MGNSSSNNEQETNKPNVIKRSDEMVDMLFGCNESCASSGSESLYTSLKDECTECTCTQTEPCCAYLTRNALHIKDDIMQIEACKAEVAQNYKKILEELECFDCQKDCVQNQMTFTNEELRNTSKKTEALHKELVKTQEELKEVEKRRETLRSKISQIETEIGDIGTTKSNLEGSLVAMKEELNKINDQRTNLQATSVIMADELKKLNDCKKKLKILFDKTSSEFKKHEKECRNKAKSANKNKSLKSVSSTTAQDGSNCNILEDVPLKESVSTTTEDFYSGIDGSDCQYSDASKKSKPKVSASEPSCGNSSDFSSMTENKPRKSSSFSPNIKKSSCSSTSKEQGTSTKKHTSEYFIRPQSPNTNVSNSSSKTNRKSFGDTCLSKKSSRTQTVPSRRHEGVKTVVQGKRRCTCSSQTALTDDSPKKIDKCCGDPNPLSILDLKSSCSFKDMKALREMIAEEYEKVKKEMEDGVIERSRANVPSSCQYQKDLLIDCYKKHPKQTIRCDAEVQSFVECVVVHRYSKNKKSKNK